MEKTIINKGKQVVIASTLLNFMTGMMYAWSLISKALIENFNFTSKEASLPYTLFTISFSFAMLAFGKLYNSKGPRFLGTIGAFFAGIGFLLSGFIINPFTLIITIGIISGMGVGIITVTTTPTAIKWYPENMKGKITGIVVTGVGLSSVFFSPLVNLSIKFFGLLRTFTYLGAVVLISTIMLAQLLTNPPKDFNLSGNKGKVSDKSQSKDYSWEEMAKTKNFYKLWIMFSLNSSAGLMIISHISNIVKLQAKWEGGFILVILIAIFNSLGRLVGGILSDKIGRINFMRMTFILQGINMALFVFYNSVLTMFIGVIIVGFCYGSSFSVFPATIGDYYGTKNFSINYGLLFTAWGLGGIIGPTTGAAIFDAMNTYNLAYTMALVLLVLSIFITFTFKDTKQD